MTYEKLNKHERQEDSKKPYERVPRATFLEEYKANVTDMNNLLANGICMEDPRKCPMTSKNDELTKAEDPHTIKDSYEFPNMHVPWHTVLTPGDGHGYCMRCDTRYCCDPEKNCFS